MTYLCPVCGWDQLTEEPYDRDGNPSYEICPCCGFEFGFDDGSRQETFAVYRKKWLEKGATWFDPDACPAHWDLSRQLRKVEK
jgi:hypothetical protein